MKQSLKWISKYVNLPLEDKQKINEIIDRVAIQIVDVDERWEENGDTIMDIDNKIVTNRPYNFGHRGMAREIAVMLALPYSGDRYTTLPEPTGHLPLVVEVASPKLCPRFCTLSIKGVKVGPSPEWLKSALESIGQRSINNLVDITNYIMFDTAQPVHAYDYDKVASHKIIVRSAQPNEKITTLDGIERTLSEEMLLITDPEKPIGIAGVMGGNVSEIDENTTNIILEVANFNPSNIRDTARKLHHRTDAVQRFEKGPDIQNIPNVIAEMASLIIEVCGGELASELIDIKNFSHASVRTEPLEISFDRKRVAKLLGFDLEDAFIEQVLGGFEIQVLSKIEEQWKLLVPTLRPDIKENSDIIEEIGRMYGYQNIPNRPPINAIVPPTRNIKLEVIRKAKTALLASGLNEVITYSFISDKEIELLKEESPLPLVNPLSNDYKYLRPSLLTSHLKVLSNNVKYFDEIGIFEVSRKFKKNLNPTQNYDQDHGESLRPLEIQVISGVYTDKKLGTQGIYVLKGALDALFTDILSKEDQKTLTFLPEGEIKVQNKTVGKIGLSAPKMTKFFDIDSQVAYFELDLNTLIDLYDAKRLYKKFSKQQITKVDYSVLVDTKTPISQLTSKIPELTEIVKWEVVDVYENPKEQERKSISIRFYLQKEESSLTASEIYEIGLKIEENFKQLSNLEIRGGGVKKPLNYVPSENATETPTSLDKIVVGKIQSIVPHPDADRLVICQVDVGQAKPENTLSPDLLQIITGADNIKPGTAEGKLIPVALPGAVVTNYKTGETITIKIGKLRGEVSEGMLCAKKELGIEDEVGGIWILDESYSDKIGEPFLAK